MAKKEHAGYLFTIQGGRDGRLVKCICTHTQPLPSTDPRLPACRRCSFLSLLFCFRTAGVSVASSPTPSATAPPSPTTRPTFSFSIYLVGTTSTTPSSKTSTTHILYRSKPELTSQTYPANQQAQGSSHSCASNLRAPPPIHTLVVVEPPLFFAPSPPFPPARAVGERQRVLRKKPSAPPSTATDPALQPTLAAGERVRQL